MKVSLAVLREMADLPADPEAVAAALNALGMAVEEVIVVTGPIESVVCARVLRCEKHPDAAKVTRVWVDAGDGVERHVWCGATNMGPGDVVPLALPGASLPDGRTIARRAILGIESEGMLCAPGEIGVPGDDAGLLLLPSDAPLGESPHRFLGLESDVIFDLDLTRNRPECWGHAGVARDLAAHFAVPYRGPRIEVPTFGNGAPVPVRIEDGDGCGLFSATLIGGIRVTESPAWVRARLASLGMRAINNVVDASNLVMLECNQPNHAYDTSVVSGVVVRRARPGETLVTLDGARRDLAEADLLICNQDDVPVGLAGVMGAENSEVTAATTEILLEIAWFDPDTIRHGAQRHGLRSEASIRFERGVDPTGVAASVARFVTILRETCPGLKIAGDPSTSTTPACPSPARITLRLSTVRRILGLGLGESEIRSRLEPIGFSVGPGATADEVAISAPASRPDCAEEIDIVEEIARHVGYDNLGRRAPRTSQAGALSESQKRRRLARSVLLGLGLDEVMPSPFLAPGELSRCGLDEDSALALANPLAAEESILRTSLRPGMLRAAAHNVNHRVERIRLWEMGRVWPRGEGPLPAEFEQLGILVVGAEVDTALAQWAALSDALGVGAQLDQRRVPEGLHRGRSAVLARGKTVVGAVGEIDPSVAMATGVRARMSWLEVNMTLLLGESPKTAKARPVSNLPSADIDLSFEVASDAVAGELHRALRQEAGALAAEVRLFDVWRDDGGTRALAFRLRLQPSDKTLSDSEIADIRARCIAAAAKTGAKLRGGVE